MFSRRSISRSKISRASGYAMVESLIAIGILASLMIGLSGLFAVTLNMDASTRQSRARDMLVRQARLDLATLSLAESPDPLFYNAAFQRVYSSSEASYRVEFTQLSEKQGQSLGPHLKHLQLTLLRANQKKPFAQMEVQVRAAASTHS